MDNWVIKSEEEIVDLFQENTTGTFRNIFTNHEFSAP